MKKFKIFVNGKNYLICEGGKPPRKFGFYTNVFVKAQNAKQAGRIAVKLLRNDSKLRTASENPKSDPPAISVESVEEIQSFEGCKLPRTGLALYDEERETEV